MKPFFHVITITFNDLEGLKATHASLASQTCQDYLWLVVDGGSEDGTREWLEQLHQPGLEWKSEPDGGIYNAMNKGIERLEGKPGYVLFLNSGDLLATPDVLEQVQLEINSAGNSPVFVYGDAVETRPGGEKIYRPARPASWIGKGMPTHHQAMFFLFRENDPRRYREEFRLAADYAFVYEWIHGPGDNDTLYINRPLCEFSLAGVSGTQRLESIREDFHIRVRLMQMPRIKALALYIAHFTHYYLKKYFGMLFRRPGSYLLDRK